MIPAVPGRFTATPRDYQKFPADMDSTTLGAVAPASVAGVPLVGVEVRDPARPAGLPDDGAVPAGGRSRRGYSTPCSVSSATSSADIPSSPVRIAALSSPYSGAARSGRPPR